MEARLSGLRCTPGIRQEYLFCLASTEAHLRQRKYLCYVASTMCAFRLSNATDKKDTKTNTNLFVFRAIDGRVTATAAAAAAATAAAATAAAIAATAPVTIAAVTIAAAVYSFSCCCWHRPAQGLFPWPSPAHIAPTNGDALCLELLEGGLHPHFVRGAAGARAEGHFPPLRPRGCGGRWRIEGALCRAVGMGQVWCWCRCD